MTRLALLVLLACTAAVHAQTAQNFLTQPGTCATETLFIGGEGCTRPEGAPDAPPAIAAACQAGQENLELGTAYALQCCPTSCSVTIGTGSAVQYPIAAAECASCPAIIAAGAGCNEISCTGNFCTVETVFVECEETTPPPPVTPPPPTPPTPTTTPPPPSPPKKKHILPTGHGLHHHKHILSPTGPLFRKHQDLITRLRKRKEALLAQIAEIDHHLG